MIVTEPIRIILKIDSTGSLTPDKKRAIELGRSYLRMFEMDIGDWVETGAHKDGENVWIAGFRREAR